MDNYIRIIILLLLSFRLSGQSIETTSAFDVNSTQPIDTRFVINEFSDTISINYLYKGLITYVLDLDAYYYYNGANWVLMSVGTSGFADDGTYIIPTDTTKNVGIGTTSPSATLDVNGAGEFSGTVSGSDPVNSDDFATKNYTDNNFVTPAESGTKIYTDVADGVVGQAPSAGLGALDDLYIILGKAFWYKKVSGFIEPEWVFQGQFNTYLTESNGNYGLNDGSPLERFSVGGAIKIGTTDSLNSGAIRWTGVDFEGYDGSEWKSLTSGGGGGGDGAFTDDGINVVQNDTTKNVGIGTTSPISKLDVRVPISTDAITVMNQDSTHMLFEVEVGGSGNPNLFMTDKYGNRVVQLTTSSGGTSYFANDGVGIGTTNPAHALDVNGNIYTNASIFLNNTSPTIFLQDTDHYSGMIHMNSNLMYFLSGNGVNGTSWATNGSYWPLYINMANDEAHFGGDIIQDEGYFYLSEQSAPSTPSSGKGVFYLKTDGLPYYKGDDGAEINVGGAAGTIAETFMLVANGESVTVQSGTYSLANVTSSQLLSTSYADVNGCSVTYTPPAGSQQVVYSCKISVTHYDVNPLAHFRLYVGGAEVTQAQQTSRVEYHIGYVEVEWMFPIGGSADAASGRQATWTTGKEIKVQAREYSSTYEVELNDIKYFDGTSSSGIMRPRVKITSIY